MSPPRNRPHLTSEREHEAYDEGWCAGHESIAASLQDAFRAGAEYMRSGARCLTVVHFPEALDVTAAAEGYVSALAEQASS